MVVRHGGEFVDGHALLHGDDDFVDQFTAGRTDTSAAEDFPGFRIGDDFTNPSRASMIIDLPWSLKGYEAARYGIFSCLASRSVRPTRATCGSVKTY